MILETNTGQTAYDIACFTINKCIDEKEPISNIQLQRILFILQKGFIKERGVSLFDDDFVAWKYGPVIESIYDKFSGSGGVPIYSKVETTHVPISIQRIINPIIEKTATMYPWNLLKYCTEKNGAWYVTYNMSINYGDVIDKELIIYEAERDAAYESNLKRKLKAMGKDID